MKIPDDIKNLLVKYYEGSTTIEEEIALKSFFGNSIPDESTLPEYTLFTFTKQNRNITIDKTQIWDSIKKRNLKNRRIRLFLSYSSVAASLLIFIAITLSHYIKTDQFQNAYYTETYNNPKEAYDVALKYFSLVSSKLSYACIEVKPIDNFFLPFNTMNSFGYFDMTIMNVGKMNALSAGTNNLKYLELFDNFKEEDDKN